MALIYVDTNIYLDFLLDRHNKEGKSFATDAFKLFSRAIECEFEILISKKIKTELYPQIRSNESAFLFSMLKPKLRLVPISEEDVDEARNLDPLNTEDALHAILANRHNADFLVTQNIQHFKKFSDKVRIVRPSEI